MKIRLLPSNIAEPHRLQPLTTFLINDEVAVDGGSLGFALGLQEQKIVRDIIVTHAHSDHVATLPIFIAEVFPFLEQAVVIHSTRETIQSLREHIFNSQIWPDFSRIELLNRQGPSLAFSELEHRKKSIIRGVGVTPVWVNHTVPTTGLIMEDESAAVIFTADTYHTDEIWQLANETRNLKALFVDVSFPNSMEKLASDSRHLTPQGLVLELKKLKGGIEVIPVHLKPQFRDEVIRELTSLSMPNVHVGEIGRDYVF
jgi:cAMP phosphodiesterase